MSAAPRGGLAVAQSPSKLQRFTPPRTFGETGARRADIKKQAIRAGSIIIAWNMLHATFFDLFRDLAFPDDEKLANRLWHTIQNDGSQREMLAHVLESANCLPVKFKRGLLWAITMTGKLASNRNDFAHLSYMWFPLKDSYEVMIPDYFGARESAAVRRVKHGKVDWRKLYGDLIAIKHYVDYIDLSINNGDILKHPAALPYRLDYNRSQQGTRTGAKSVVVR